MAWDLTIHTIDVGQGESSLIIAQDLAAAPVLRRTMLIDGGIAEQGPTVNTFLQATIAGLAIDHLVVSHYDVDHSGGIMSLLGADNLYSIADTVATVALTQANLGTNRAQQIAAGAAGACAALLGAYAIPGGTDCSASATMAGFSIRGYIGVAVVADDEAAADGVKEAERAASGAVLNSWLIPPRSTTKRRQIAREIGVEAADAIAAGGGAVVMQNTVRAEVFRRLQTLVGNRNCRFSTEGRFATTHLLDTGNANMPAKYADYAAGRIMMGSTWVQAPTVNRQRTTANLGDEILWNSGANPQNPPANAPTVHVLALNQYMWNAPPAAVPIGQAIDNNADSYGLILRFNHFFFYTGGDLPTAGEDLIATAVMTHGLPDPSNALVPYPLPHCIAVFKCGHHGANTCTSNNFLTTISPRAALISCGSIGAFYGHPEQNLVNRLENCAPLDFFFLTGFQTGAKTHIPATQTPPGNQFTAAGNKAFVAGDTVVPPVHLGNLHLTISQAEATSNSATLPLGPGDASLRQFHLTYWEDDAIPPQFLPVTIIF